MLSLVNPDFEQVVLAKNRIREFVHKTPVITCSTLDLLSNSQLFLKCENFQKVGAFKFRGAMNSVLLAEREGACQTFITHSSGNHAQALASAAKQRGHSALIVMPSNAPEVKKRAVQSYGGEITFCEPTLEARESTVRQIIQERNAVFIHPYDNPHIICGQGTSALELLEEVPDLDILIAPVGGGGLLSGTAIAAKGINPAIQIFGAEPENADDAFRSLRDGVLHPSINPCTIADGLLTSLSELTFKVIKEHVSHIVTVSEDEIRSAMEMVFERVKIVIEPSAATPIAAVLNNKDLFENKRVGIIISGGNIDFKSGHLAFHRDHVR